MFDLQWVWLLWFVVLGVLVFDYGFRGFLGTIFGFCAYLLVRAFTPQLGPWGQLLLYLGVGALVSSAGFCLRQTNNRWR